MAGRSAGQAACVGTPVASHAWDAQQVDVDGASTGVLRSGAAGGEPTLLLHGVPDSADLWEGVAQLLPGTHACCAPDLPGFRRSEVPRGYAWTLQDHADWVRRVIAAAGLPTPLTVVGHDWGGVFALACAAAHPTLVQRVVVLDAPFDPSYRWHAWARAWRTPVVGELSLALMTRRGLARELRRGSRHLPEGHVDATYRGGALLARRTRRAVLALYRGGDPAAFGPWQPRLAAARRAGLRLDAVWGADDPYVPVEQASALAPDSLLVLEDTGHWPPVERPAAVADVVRRPPAR